jgi:hypothetical protein
MNSQNAERKYLLPAADYVIASRDSAFWHPESGRIGDAEQALNVIV